MFITTDNTYLYSSHTQEEDAVAQLARFDNPALVIKEVDDLSLYIPKAA